MNNLQGGSGSSSLIFRVGLTCGCALIATGIMLEALGLSHSRDVELPGLTPLGEKIGASYLELAGAATIIALVLYKKMQPHQASKSGKGDEEGIEMLLLNHIFSETLPLVDGLIAKNEGITTLDAHNRRQVMTLWNQYLETDPDDRDGSKDRILDLEKLNETLDQDQLRRLQNFLQNKSQTNN